MAKNLVNGTNVVIEENGDNINMNLSSTYNTNLQQEINDSFKENNIYSTTETVVGTWIDSKPIYRKVINYSVNTGATSYDIASLNIDIPVKFYTIIKRTSSDYIDYETPYYVSGSDYFRSFIRVTQSNEDMSIETRLAASYTTYRQYIILEYTKKTD